MNSFLDKWYLIFPFIAYLLGSIPTAVWVGKRFFNTDVREHGSNNAGATNTFRVLGKKPGVVVLIIDVVKGICAVYLPKLLLNLEANNLMLVMISCGVMAIMGHIFPVFARFKGGKGVATSLGVVIGLHPMTALICIGVFLLFFLIFKYVSLGAIMASLTFPVLLLIVFPEESVYLKIFAVIMGSLVIIMHHQNIKRLLQGKENRMNLFKKSP